MSARRAAVLASAAGPRQWCRASVRRTAAVDDVDLAVRAVCAVRPRLPRLVTGPLLGRTIEACTATGDPPDGDGDHDGRTARRDRRTPDPAPGPDRTDAPVRPTEARGAGGPSAGPRAPRPVRTAGVTPERLRELAGPGAGRRAVPGAGTAPSRAAQGRVAAPRPGDRGPAPRSDRTEQADRPGPRVTGAVHLPPRPGSAPLPAAVTARLARRAGLGVETVGRLASAALPGPSGRPDTRVAVRAVLADVLSRSLGAGRAQERRAPEGPGAGPVGAPGSPEATSRRRPTEPAADVVRAPAPSTVGAPDRVPPAMPSAPDRATGGDALPVAVRGPADRAGRADGSADAPPPARGTEPGGARGTGAGLAPSLQLAPPDLERLMDQVLTDAARRHGIEV